jgi:hypothetical protein
VWQQWPLRQTFSRREEAGGLLENLEKLRQEGSIDEESYEHLRAEYQESLSQAQAEIGRIRELLREALSKREQELQSLRGELNTLEARFKVGQVGEKDYRRQQLRIGTRMEGKEKEILELQGLLATNSSIEVEGVIGVKVGPATGVSGTALPEIRLPSFGSLENVFTPLRIAGLLVSVLMLVFVFLPWVSVDWYEFSFNFKGLETVSTQEDKVREFNAGGIFVLLAAILGMAVSLLATRSSSRGWGYIGTAILVIIGIVVFSVVFGNSYADVSEQVNGEGLSFRPEIGGIFSTLTVLAILIIARLEFAQKQ